jgi:transcriptional regulator with XRE-family HTH domain
MADPLFSETGAALRHARLQLGWSQELFAEKAIVSLGTIKAAENGSRLYPKTHRALVDAINKARAACRPPVGALTLEFPVPRTSTPKPADDGALPSAETELDVDPAPYPETPTEERKVNED